MSGPRTRLVALLSLILGIVLTGSVAAPKQVIEPGIGDQGFPSFIQEQRQKRMRIAQPNDTEQPGPAGSGIDECVAHCSNGVGW
jgi:hypothetical protein